MKHDINDSSLENKANYGIQLTLWEDPKFLEIFDYLTSLGFVPLPEDHPAVLACPWLKKHDPK